VTDNYVLAAISLHNMAGGLERNIVSLANRLAECGHRVSLVTFDWETAQSFYPINEGIRWFKVATSQPHQAIGFTDRLRLIARIRKALKDADASVVVCFHHGILARFLLASLLLNVRVVASERNSLSLYAHTSQSKWNLNFFLMYFVDRITVQFPQYVNDYPRLLRSRVVAIPNPVLPVENFAAPGRAKAGQPFQLLAVGRLSAQKNFEALVAAFAKLADRCPAWELIIVGDGERHERLRAEIEKHNLNARVRLLPATRSVFDLYRNASVFCMPSKWEGFPNALAEAMAHGLPVIGYAGCAGVRELIVHGENGLLATGNGDVDSLSDALEGLMSNPGRREEMGKAAADSVQRFNPERVFPLWEDLLQRVAALRSKAREIRHA